MTVISDVYFDVGMIFVKNGGDIWKVLLLEVFLLVGFLTKLCLYIIYAMALHHELRISIKNSKLLETSLIAPENIKAEKNLASSSHLKLEK